MFTVLIQPRLRQRHPVAGVLSMSFNQRSNARRLLTVWSDRNGSPCISAHTVKCRESIHKTEARYLTWIPPFPRKVGQQRSFPSSDDAAENCAKSAQLFSTFAGPISRSLGVFLFLKQMTGYLLNILDHKTTDVSGDKKSAQLFQHLRVLHISGDPSRQTQRAVPVFSCTL